LIRGIYGYGFERPSLIQQQAIVPLINGHDTIAQAQSGTGKTGAYSIAALQLIDQKSDKCQVLILVPTRELAQQIQGVILCIGEYLNVMCYSCVGGTARIDDKKRLR
jgi:translation initiation factor 4A